MKPAFSNPDNSRLSVTPGVTPADKNQARYVRFVPAPDIEDDPAWFDEHDERL